MPRGLASGRRVRFMPLWESHLRLCQDNMTKAPPGLNPPTEKEDCPPDQVGLIPGVTPQIS